MKIKESYLHEALKADKNDQLSRTNDVRRQSSLAHSEAANKLRQTDSPLKDEMKFADLLESSTKLQKNQPREDSGEEQREDRKKDRKHTARAKDSADNLAAEERLGKYESTGGQTGGQGGFGMGGNVSELNLSESFAARSILHIADLERLVSTVRTQTGLGGKREIILQLKRSVLEGLQVKILTDGSARVNIEFLAANQKVRSQIENHREELAGILRGRGLNLHRTEVTSLAPN
ncbi:MAG: hypothetical protein ABJA66_16760, partial [Actinomycetota bacterium]